MSLNCPSTTAVALKSGAGLPILAFPDDMVAVVARYCSRDSTAHVDKHSWVEPEAPPAALTAVTPTSGFKPSPEAEPDLQVGLLYLLPQFVKPLEVTCKSCSTNREQNPVKKLT